MPSNLTPIWRFENYREDIEKYEAKSERKEVSFKDCPHKKVFIVDGVLKCKCGASWHGQGIHELHRLLTT